MWEKDIEGPKQALISKRNVKKPNHGEYRKCVFVFVGGLELEFGIIFQNMDQTSKRCRLFAAPKSLPARSDSFLRNFKRRASTKSCWVIKKERKQRLDLVVTRLFGALHNAGWQKTIAYLHNTAIYSLEICGNYINKPAAKLKLKSPNKEAQTIPVKVINPAWKSNGCFLKSVREPYLHLGGLHTLKPVDKSYSP